MKRGAGARSRARLAQTARFARSGGLIRSRAQRFATGDAAPSPTLTEIVQWPLWPALDAEEQQRVFALTALVSARDALAEVISGSDLRDYAAPFGNDLFERALVLKGSGTRRLAPPQRLAADGEQLARCGLPPALARGLGETVAGEPEAALHVAEAEGLLQP